MDGIVKYLEEKLNLPVNKEKSGVWEIKHVRLLGFQILRGKIRMSNKSRLKFKDKIRKLTRRDNPLSMHRSQTANSDSGSYNRLAVMANRALS
ncbi:MAG: hypothetical protein KAV87_03415 [Desulfobacteraceae bacterium]|jgi:hypothetical protein|nr:hypothetical protein [Desulfobacteraceae bacterium]